MRTLKNLWKSCTQHAAIQRIAKRKTYIAWWGACGSQQAEQPRPGSSSILSRALKTKQGSIRTFEEGHNFERKKLKSCAQHAAMHKRSRKMMLIEKDAEPVGLSKPNNPRPPVHEFLLVTGPVTWRVTGPVTLWKYCGINTHTGDFWTNTYCGICISGTCWKSRAHWLFAKIRWIKQMIGNFGCGSCQQLHSERIGCLTHIEHSLAYNLYSLLTDLCWFLQAVQYCIIV